MHTLVLCLWLLGTVSGGQEDDQSQRPIYIISPKGTPPGYSNGQPFYGAPVSSNDVRVLPNAYGTSQDVNTSGIINNPISVPAIVNKNTSFQGNTNQPIPVLVSYPDDGSIPSGQSQPVYGINPLPIQRPPSPGVTPIPVLVKAPASLYPRTFGSTPSPFKARSPETTNENSSENPYMSITPTFRLWPKLPDPVPVPVLIADAFVRNTHRNLNTNLLPQYLQQVPAPNKAPASLTNGYQQSPDPFRYPSNSQFQTQPNQLPNQGPIYIILPGGNNNAQSGSYQTPPQTRTSFQSQTPQPGNQGFIIVVPPGTNSQSNQAEYQNDRYPSNTNFRSQLQSQYGQQQSPLNYAVLDPSNVRSSQTQAQPGQQAPLDYNVFDPANVPSSQRQAQSGQQSPLNYAVFDPANVPSTQTQAQSGQQAPLSYAIFNPANVPNSQTQAQSSQQAPLNYAIFNPANVPNSQTQAQSNQQPPLNYAVPANTPGSQPQPLSADQQSALKYAIFGPPNAPGSSAYPAGQTLQSFSGYANANILASQSSNAAGQSPLIYSELRPSNGGSSPTPTPSPFVGYSSTQFSSPQYAGYSSTPAPPQTNSQSTTVSRVSFSGGGGSYSYSV